MRRTACEIRPAAATFVNWLQRVRSKKKFANGSRHTVELELIEPASGEGSCFMRTEWGAVMLGYLMVKGITDLIKILQLLASDREHTLRNR